jgi:hypothetical protein
VYMFLPDLILKPYGLAERPELRAIVVSLLRFVAFYSFFDSMLVVLTRPSAAQAIRALR